MGRIGIAALAASPAEKHIKNIAEAAEVLAVEAASAHTLVRIHMAVPVIGGALLVVAQHVVRFLRFLELFFRVGGFVHVRMVLARRLAESLLNVLRTGAFVHAKHLVIIPLAHCSTAFIEITWS
ncbi:hypothetical protein D3C75_765320 [compost metagenome]